MEDLQDVLEDVTYMNAMSDDSPKPTKPWEFPDEPTLKEFCAKELEADPACFTLEKICDNYLGFYLFCKFCKLSGDDARTRFLEDIMRYKRAVGDKQKAIIANGVLKKFLQPCQKPLEPAKTDINEADLRRSPPPTMMPREELASFYEEAVRVGAGLNVINLGGPARDEVADYIEREAEPLLADLESQQSAGEATTKKSSSSTRRRGTSSASRKTHGQSGVTSDKTQGGQEQRDNSDLVRQEHGATGTGVPQLPPVSPAHTKGSMHQVGYTGSTDGESDLDPNKATMEAPLSHSQSTSGTANISGMSVEEESFWSRRIQKFQAHLFDPMEALLWEALTAAHRDAFHASPQFKQYQQFVHLAKKPVSEDDFTLFRVLGRGGFGQVNGCKRCQTGKLYAMKVMNKRRVKAHQSEKLCWNERKILSLVDSPFVVCLKYSFTSKEDLFLILDLMRGGDLAFHLDKRGRFTMEEARYFAARTLLGLQHLHKNNIVYRDLKPDNILMDERGKTRISDLGLACKVTPDLVGTYGTRGYWAPEMLMKDSKGHRIRYNQCVDWFSFGCVVYEMIVGFSPFRSEKIYEWSGLTKKDKHKVIDMAVIGMDPDFDRRYFDDDSIDLCKKLLEKDPRKRLGSRGSADVMAHPWFTRGGVEWDLMIADAVDPPFVPNQDINAASQSAIGSFNDENQYRKLKMEDADHEIYNGWGWSSQSSFFAEVVQFLKAEEIQGPIVPQQNNEGCCTLL